LANKAALGCRVDALGDENTKKIGMESLKSVLRAMGAEGKTATIGTVPVAKYMTGETSQAYDTAADIKMDLEEEPKDRKRKRESNGGEGKEKKHKK